MNDKTINFKLGNQIFETCKKNGEIKLLNLVYTPETETLSVYCSYDYDKSGETHLIDTYLCTPLEYAIILTGVINDTQWITANTKEPANIAVECGAFR